MKLQPILLKIYMMIHGALENQDLLQTFSTWTTMYIKCPTLAAFSLNLKLKLANYMYINISGSSNVRVFLMAIHIICINIIYTSNNEQNKFLIPDIQNIRVTLPMH